MALDAFNFWAPWGISAVTVWSMWLAGSNHRQAWAVALGGQFLWLAWIITSESWGLLPSNIVLWGVYGRNYLRRRKECA